MRLLGWGKTKETESDSKLSEAERRVTDLECRSASVVESLTRRNRRNHWGQTVTEIAHGKH